ncbi:MAG: hypothetical protein HGA45_27805 [Chloroflexales bacterium]|nr:hypothetical protein [Chloroflexales bacterium]
MASKTDFTPEEWQTIGLAPIITGLYISMSDPSGPIGLIKETFASASSIIEAAKQPDALQIVKDLAADMEAKTLKPELPKFKSADEAAAFAKEQLTKAVALIEGKSPEDAGAYRQWLYDTAKKAAEAGKEGGFLGFGGTAVSEKEQAALIQIAAILGVTPA